MIAVVEPFEHLAAPRAALALPAGAGGPAKATVTLRALLSVAKAAARVRRIALNAIRSGKSAATVARLMETHRTLLHTQMALAETVALLLEPPAAGSAQPALG